MPISGEAMERIFERSGNPVNIARNQCLETLAFSRESR
jgi:hypothetical protein